MAFGRFGRVWTWFQALGWAIQKHQAGKARLFSLAGCIDHWSCLVCAVCNRYDSTVWHGVLYKGSQHTLYFSPNSMEHPLNRLGVLGLHTGLCAPLSLHTQQVWVMLLHTACLHALRDFHVASCGVLRIPVLYAYITRTRSHIKPITCICCLTVQPVRRGVADKWCAASPGAWRVGLHANADQNQPTMDSSRTYLCLWVCFSYMYLV
jgi:hypothetical protein